MITAPGKIFRDYARDMIRIELAKPRHRHSPLDVLGRRLWDAAAFDSYIIGQNTKPLLDDLGVARGEAREYAAIIEAAIAEYKAVVPDILIHNAQ